MLSIFNKKNKIEHELWPLKLKIFRYLRLNRKQRPSIENNSHLTYLIEKAPSQNYLDTNTMDHFSGIFQFSPRSTDGEFGVRENER